MKLDIFIIVIFIIILIFCFNYKEKEDFIVADAQDINNYPYLRQRVLEMSDNFDTEDEKIGTLPCPLPSPNCMLSGEISLPKPAYLEDPCTRGANYNEYSNFASPTAHIRILSQNTKGLPPDQMMYKNIPTASNFAFHNSPSF